LSACSCRITLHISSVVCLRTSKGSASHSNFPAAHALGSMLARKAATTGYRKLCLLDHERTACRIRSRSKGKGVMEKCGGRKNYAEARPEVVALARELSNQHMSLHKIISRACPARTGDDYDVLSVGEVVGRIFKSPMAMAYRIMASAI
jgi:hypothetical protein